MAKHPLSTSIRVLIRLGQQWSAVGAATVERDADSGAYLLRLDLTAMAARVYVPLRDLAAARLELRAAEEEGQEERCGTAADEARPEGPLCPVLIH